MASKVVKLCVLTHKSLPYIYLYGRIISYSGPSVAGDSATVRAASTASLPPAEEEAN